MLHLLSGTDRFRVAQRRAQLEREFVTTTPTGTFARFDVEENWGEEARSRVAEMLSSDGLFMIPQLVLVRGLETLTDRDGEWLGNLMEHSSATHTVVLSLLLAPRKKSPVWWQVLSRVGQAETFTSSNSLDAWAVMESILTEYGVTIDPVAKTTLVEAFGKDLGKLTQECIRLALAARQQKITLAQVGREVVLPKEYNVFAALDSLTRGDTKQALRLFRDAETDPDAPFALLGLCAWQVRRLIVVKELSEQAQMSADQIARELKTSPYPIQKTLPLLPKLSFARLRHALTLLADFDQAVKSGQMQPGVALDLFVWKF